ncbi:MAG: hypothetical protein ACREBE_29690, partial [bacterium]
LTARPIDAGRPPALLADHHPISQPSYVTQLVRRARNGDRRPSGLPRRVDVLSARHARVRAGDEPLVKSRGEMM